MNYLKLAQRQRYKEQKVGQWHSNGELFNQLSQASNQQLHAEGSQQSLLLTLHLLCSSPSEEAASEKPIMNITV